MIREGQKRAWARVKAGEGFMYVAELTGGSIKVGFSLDPEHRTRWPAYRLLGAFRASRAAEHAFHKHMQARLGAKKRTEIYTRQELAGVLGGA